MTKLDDSRADIQRRATLHAKNLVAAVKTEPSVYGIARTLMERAQREPAIAKLFISIQDALGSGQDLLDEQQSAVLDRVSPGEQLEIPTAPDWLRPAIASAYLLAKSSLTPRVAASIVTEPAKAMRQTLRVARSLEAGFIGEFIVESALAQQDARVAARLAESAAEFRPLVADLYSRVSADSIARAANTGSGGACEACRGGACTPISCWVIVVVVIVVIVTGGK